MLDTDTPRESDGCNVAWSSRYERTIEEKVLMYWQGTCGFVARGV